MEYITERVLNISELEALIGTAYDTIVLARKKLELKNPPMDQIGELAKQLHLCLLKAKDFEFCIEQRKAVFKDYREDQ